MVFLIDACPGRPDQNIEPGIGNLTRQKKLKEMRAAFATPSIYEGHIGGGGSCSPVAP